MMTIDTDIIVVAGFVALGLLAAIGAAAVVFAVVALRASSKIEHDDEGLRKKCEERARKESTR